MLGRLQPDEQSRTVKTVRVAVHSPEHKFHYAAAVITLADASLLSFWFAVRSFFFAKLLGFKLLQPYNKRPPNCL
jgi:hypothetical protein